MRLKSRRKDIVEPLGPGHHPGGMPKPTGVPVVDGVPVEPYELPDDPSGNERALRQIAEDRERQAQSKATMFARGLRAIAQARRARKGPGWERTFFNRWTVEWHESPTTSGRRRTLEITFVDRKHMRGVRWNFIIELWRAK